MISQKNNDINTIFFKRCDVNAHLQEASSAVKIHMADDDKRRDDDEGGRNDNTVLLEPKQKLKRPSLYRVLLLNDDYTPMEFVIHVLERFFNKTHEEATEVMLHVHHRGVGECGVYTFEVAETKVTQVMNLAKEHQHPLQCVMEKK
jgi:ATP-dependent Clp protease adaptor protein ClpS